MTKFTWNEENTAQLVELAGDQGAEVSQETVSSIADEIGTTARSVGAKLRNMDYTVQKATAKVSAWTEAQEAALRQLVEANANKLTYAEISAAFEGGSFTAKQVQGKLLSMELFGLVRKADKVAAQKTYTEAEENTFVSMVSTGATLETLAAEFDRTIASVRGKALSLLRAEKIEAMPKQETSSAKERSDMFEGLELANMTVAEIAEATEKTERGIKSALSRRGITCQDYDGEAKRAKLDAAK
jgi:hypothetical protein